MSSSASSSRISGRGQRVRDNGAGRHGVTNQDQAGREARQHRGRRSSSRRTTRMPAIPGLKSTCGRCRGDAAGAHRSGEGHVPADRKASSRSAAAQELADTRQRLVGEPGRGLGREPYQHSAARPIEVTQIKDLDWALVSRSDFVSRWPMRLWAIDKRISSSVAPAARVSATVRRRPSAPRSRNKKHGAFRGEHPGRRRPDVRPGVLWTAAHHQIPLLSVMHNNRAYHQEVMHIQRMANRQQRGVTTAPDRHEDRQSEYRFRRARELHGQWSAGRS